MSITYKAFNNKDGYSWAFYKKVYKYKNYKLEYYGQIKCKSQKKKKNWRYKTENIEIRKESGKIVEITSYIAYKNNFYKFVFIFLFFFTPFRPNTSIKLKLVNILKLLLINLLSQFKSSAWIGFLWKYPKLSDFKLYLLMILCFRIKQGYESLFNAFIILDNLISVF